jgi:hypothetical protein
MTEPVVALGWADQLALADVLILSAWEPSCANVFVRWPGLAMVVFPAGEGTVTVITRDGRMLTASGASTMDIVRVVHEQWSLSCEVTQAGPHWLRACREG